MEAKKYRPLGAFQEAGSSVDIKCLPNILPAPEQAWLHFIPRAPLIRYGRNRRGSGAVSAEPGGTVRKEKGSSASGGFFSGAEAGFRSVKAS
jgi:hypothetical protein